MGPRLAIERSDGLRRSLLFNYAVERFNFTLSLSGADAIILHFVLIPLRVQIRIIVCDLRLQSNPYTLKRSSGCSCFALDVAGETYRLAVAVKKKLYFFTWNGDKFLDNSKVQITGFVCFV